MLPQLGMFALGAGALSGLASTYLGYKQYLLAKKAANINNLLSAYSLYNQTDVADSNLQYQRETLDYQKQLQKEIFAREDSAVQRRVDDLKKAGLNPLLAAGGAGAGAGSVVGVITPQQQNLNVPRFQGNDISMLRGSIQDAFSNLVTVLNTYTNLLSSTNALELQKEEIKFKELLNKEKSLQVQEKASELDVKNKMNYHSQYLDAQIKLLQNDLVSKQLDVKSKNIDVTEKVKYNKILEDALKSLNVNTQYTPVLKKLVDVFLKLIK